MNENLHSAISAASTAFPLQKERAPRGPNEHRDQILWDHEYRLWTNEKFKGKLRVGRATFECILDEIEKIWSKHLRQWYHIFDMTKNFVIRLTFKCIFFSITKRLWSLSTSIAANNAFSSAVHRREFLLFLVLLRKSRRNRLFLTKKLLICIH